MLKPITTIILLTAFLAQTFNRVFIVIDFYENQAFIKANLCENRYRPQLHCDGHCLLMKKLQKEEKKEQRNPERKLENGNEVFTCLDSYPVLSTRYSVHILSAHHSNKGRPVDRSFDFFHPPTA